MKTTNLIFSLISLATAVFAVEPTVSYAPSPRKSISVPEVNKMPVLDGNLKDRVWKKASVIQDFQRYRSSKAVTAETRIYFMRCQDQLLIGFDCEEPLGITRGSAEPGTSPWSGDGFEIFFGGCFVAEGSLQLAFNIAGNRFCDNVSLMNAWEVKTRTMKKRWTAELRIPISVIEMKNGGCRFNICRQRLKAGENSQWSKTYMAFAEPEHFGELLFCDYRTAALIRLGRSVSEDLDRSAYEKLTAECIVPAGKIIHGPYLTYPGESTMTVNWYTAGPCSAYVEYRALNETTWQKHLANLANGVVRESSRFHFAHLSGLKPDTKYEYRLRHDYYYKNRCDTGENDSRNHGTFTTLSSKRPSYTFALFSDIHSSTDLMKQLWDNCRIKNFTFCINLGDMVNALNNPSDMFRQYIDAQSSLFARYLPLIPVQGNHEQQGRYHSGHQDFMPHPTGRTYFTVKHGPVLFIALDSGANMSPAFEAFYHEQSAWLNRLSYTKEYQEAKFRVVMAHYHGGDVKRHETQTMKLLLGDLINETRPERRIHLMMGGHEHVYFRINPYQKEFFNPERYSTSQIPSAPFTIVANSGSKSIRDGYENSIMAGEVTEKSLKINVFAPDGGYIDCFEILPDGKLNDLRYTMR